MPLSNGDELAPVVPLPTPRPRKAKMQAKVRATLTKVRAARATTQKCNKEIDKPKPRKPSLEKKKASCALVAATLDASADVPETSTSHSTEPMQWAPEEAQPTALNLQSVNSAAISGSGAYREGVGSKGQFHQPWRFQPAPAPPYEGIGFPEYHCT